MTDQTTPRDRLFALIASIPGSASVDWCDDARALVDEIATPSAPLPVSEARTRLLQALDALYCQALGHTPEGLLAAYEASRTQTVDQAALDLRQRAAWVAAGRCPMCGWDRTEGRLCEDCTATVRRLPSPQRRPWRRYEPPTPHAPIQGVGYTPAQLLGVTGGAHDDAAVLPATTNHDTDTSGFELRGDTEIRAAALREAIALLDQRASSIDAFASSDFGEEARAVRELTDVANELRRVADETAATETAHQPRRGDQFEAWLKAQRDDWASDRADVPATYDALDDLLDLYRLHADTGTPLGEHVCEARGVGDCECLEQPAAGARHAETVAVPCVECGHPQTDHGEGEDPVTPGHCRTCPDDDARHDYRTAAVRQDRAQS